MPFALCVNMCGVSWGANAIPAFMRHLVLSVALFVAAIEAEAQSPVPVSELSFSEEDESVLAMRAGESETIYSLFGTTFFPSSDQLAPLVVAWLDAHPDAVATPVSALRPGAPDPTEWVFVWVTDGADTLNVHPVEQGALASMAMIDHLEMVRLTGQDEAQALRYVSDRAYEAFLERVVSAEGRALSDGLGIWSERRPRDD